MTIEQLAALLLTTGGTGAATFALIEMADKLAGPIRGAAKFYASMVLAFVLPLIGYVTQVDLGLQPLGIEGIFAAMVVGWLVAQGIHRTTEAK